MAGGHMSGPSLTILGCSSGDVQPGRATSGYLLQAGESLSLFDCGSGVVSSFLEHGFDPLKLERIFISHAHSDHLADLTLMIQKIYLTRRENPLTVYVPSELVAPLENWLRAVYLLKERFPFDLTISGFSGGLIYAGSFQVFALPNSHLNKLEPVVRELGLPNRLQSFSFSIDTGRTRLLYSADLGSFEDIRRELDSHTCFLVEATHVDLHAVLGAATRYPESTFVLTHLGTETEIAAIQATLTCAGCLNVRLAKEGMRIEL